MQLFHVILVLASLMNSAPSVFGIKKFQSATRPPVPPPPPPQIVFGSQSMIAPSETQHGYKPLSIGNSDFNVGYKPQYKPQRPTRPPARPTSRPQKPQRPLKPQRPFSSVISRPPVPIPPKPQLSSGNYVTSSVGNEQYTYISYRPQG